MTRRHDTRGFVMPDEGTATAECPCGWSVRVDNPDVEYLRRWIMNEQKRHQAFPPIDPTDPPKPPKPEPKLGYHYVDRHTTRFDVLAAMDRITLTEDDARSLLAYLTAPDADRSGPPALRFTKQWGGGHYRWPSDRAGDTGWISIARHKPYRSMEVLVHEVAHWRLRCVIIGGEREPHHGAEFVRQLDRLADLACDWARANDIYIDDIADGTA